jgi:hypothetical protein
MKYSEHEILSVEIFVNYCLVIGNDDVLNDVIDRSKAYKFGLKIADNLKDCLSCKVMTDYEKNTTFVMKTH